MRKILLFPIVLFWFSICVAQGTPKSLLDEGVALNDKGDFDGAIRKFDEAISKDEGYYLAWYEKTLTLYQSGKYQDGVDLCKQVLKKFPNEDNNKNVYCNYGSCMDGLGRPGDAIKIYKEGIKKYPDFYLLPFNRAITEFNGKAYDDASADLKRSVTLNPAHASTHLFLGYSVYEKNKIATLMALSTFLLWEPEGQRAKKNLGLMLQILGSGVKQKDEKNITISLSPSELGTKIHGEDDFHQAQLMIAMRSALDFDDKYKNLPPALNLKDKLELLVEMPDMKDSKDHGFFTRFYLPFLSKMRNNSLLETACYIMMSSSGDAGNTKWLEDNKPKVDEFNGWLRNYAWAKQDQ